MAGSIRLLRREMWARWPSRIRLINFGSDPCPRSPALPVAAVNTALVSPVRGPCPLQGLLIAPPGRRPYGLRWDMGRFVTNFDTGKDVLQRNGKRSDRVMEGVTALEVESAARRCRR